jgi:hypothetical protein
MMYDVKADSAGQAVTAETTETTDLSRTTNDGVLFSC